MQALNCESYVLKHRYLQQCLLVLQASYRYQQMSVSYYNIRWASPINVLSVAKCSHV